MNSIRSEKKIATLSIVRSITNSCLLRFGINRTNFKILSRRKVRSTDNPELPLAPSPSTQAWQSSTALMRRERTGKRTNVLRNHSIIHAQHLLHLVLCAPQDNNHTIKNIESIRNILEGTFGKDFQQHFDRKKGRKHDVAHLNDSRQLERLIVMLNSH